ncbi:MAG: TIGR00725 family protein [Thermodesulfovibrionales bacterium]|nr:TIGR00725 family protein [Thermodesulfovibrionales bacterium]
MAGTKDYKAIVAVIGGRVVEPGLLKEAEKAGRVLAKHGVVVMTGGLGGVMEAASKGARQAGGLTLGILPGEDISEANPHVSIPVATGLGIARNVIIARTADALIAVGGEYGTLPEIAHALQLKKTVAGIGSWDINGVIPASDAEEACRIVFDALGISGDPGHNK